MSNYVDEEEYDYSYDDSDPNDLESHAGDEEEHPVGDAEAEEYYIGEEEDGVEGDWSDYNEEDDRPPDACGGKQKQVTAFAVLFFLLLIGTWMVCSGKCGAICGGNDNDNNRKNRERQRGKEAGDAIVAVGDNGKDPNSVVEADDEPKDDNDTADDWYAMWYDVDDEDEVDQKDKNGKKKSSGSSYLDYVSGGGHSVGSCLTDLAHCWYCVTCPFRCLCKCMMCCDSCKKCPRCCKLCPSVTCITLILCGWCWCACQEAFIACWQFVLDSIQCCGSQCCGCCGCDCYCPWLACQNPDTGLCQTPCYTCLHNSQEDPDNDNCCNTCYKDNNDD